MVQIFIDRVKEQMKLNNITMYRLSKEINVNKQTVNFWLNGINEPKISYLLKLCEYFQVSADYLLGLSDY